MENIYPDFDLPTKLYIKPEVSGEIASILDGTASRVVIITNSTDLSKYESTIAKISESINNRGIGCLVYDELPAMPNLEYIDSAAYFAKKINCDMVIGIGGIESINAAKAVALLKNNFLFCEDLFNKPKLNPPVKFITMPTHPIYGFEILPSFHVTDIHDYSIKVFNHSFLYPTATVVDPTLATFISEEKTASSGISTLALAAETIIAKITNDFTDTYALKAIDLTFKNLVYAYKDTKNLQYRHQLAIASVMSGIAFSTSYFSMSLSIALSISSVTDIPLDTAIGMVLPHVMEYNLTASPGRFVQMAKVMDENVRDITVIEAAIKAIEGVRRLAQEIDIPQRLSQFGLSKSEFTKMAEISLGYPFLRNAPRPLNKDEIETILISAY